MQDGVLDLGDAALAVEPCRMGEIGHAVAVIALQLIAVAGGAVLVIGRLRIGDRKALELGILHDGIGVGAHQARPHGCLPGQIGGAAGDDEDRKPYSAPDLPSQPAAEPAMPAPRLRSGFKRIRSRI